jgi:hypothetical protein
MGNAKRTETEVEQRARELFDASVAALDAETRSKLNRARHEAVAAAETGRRSRVRAWLPIAALASTVLVAVLLTRMPGTGEEPATAARAGDALDPIEVLAAGEDLDLVQGDVGFYEWLDVAGFDESGGSG